MIGADRSRFGTLLEDLQNDYLQKRDNYPKTMAESYNLLTNWCTDARQPTSYHNAHDGMAFTNDGDGDEISLAKANQDGTTLANDGKPRDKSTVRCNRCQTIGHYSSECRAATPKPRVYPASSATATRATGEQMLMSAVASVKPDAANAESNDSTPSDHNNHEPILQGHSLRRQCFREQNPLLYDDLTKHKVSYRRSPQESKKWHPPHSNQSRQASIHATRFPNHTFAHGRPV
jgi:hypothetical protein